jgi:hypothetical protein
MNLSRKENLKKFFKQEISVNVEELIEKKNQKSEIFEILNIVQEFPLYIKYQDYHQVSKKIQIHKFSKFAMHSFTSLVKTVSPIWLPIETLKYESRFNQKYLENIDKLKKTIVAWRKIRGDGNCYYRSVLVGYLLKIYHYSSDPEYIERFLEKLNGLREPYQKFLEKLNNPKEQYQKIDFVNDLVQKLKSFNEFSMENIGRDFSEESIGRENSEESFNRETSEEMLKVEKYRKIEAFLQDQHFDRCLIETGRLLSLLQIEKSREQLLHFADESLFAELAKNISTWGNEAETFELLLLPYSLGIRVKQMNLYEIGIAENDFPYLEETTETDITITIISKTKGHYDLLLSTSEMEKQDYIVNEGIFLIP